VTGNAAFDFVRMLSGAIGEVVGQVVFQLLMTPHLDDFLKAGIPRDLADQLADGEAISFTRVVADLPESQQLIKKTRLTSALRGTWIFYTVISALRLLISFGIKRIKLQIKAS
jgi:hypothetical protein